MACCMILGWEPPRPGTGCSRALWARNRKRVRKGVPRPPAPGSSRVREECAPESEKSPKRVRSCVFGLFSDSGGHSSGTVGLPGAGGPGTPFRTLFGLFWGSGPEGPGSTLCQAGGFPNFGGDVLGLLYKKNNRKKAQNIPKKSYSKCSGTKTQPKEEVLGRTSLRTSRLKLRSGPPNLRKTSISERASHADVHEKTSV